MCIIVFITELSGKVDLQTLSGKTLSVTSGSSSPGPGSSPTTDTVLCPYVNLLLCNSQPAGERHTDTHTLTVHKAMHFTTNKSPGDTNTKTEFIILTILSVYSKIHLMHIMAPMIISNCTSVKKVL